MRSYLEIFVGAVSYVCPGDSQVGWICFQIRLCNESNVSAATNNLFLCENVMV